MTPTSLMRWRARRRSAGVAIVTAIFLLVVVAGLAVAVVSLTTAQQDASAKDMQGQRAYQAARAGIEWALFTGLRGGVSPAAALGCGVSRQVAWPPNDSTTLSAFTVTVTTRCDVDTPSGVVGGANDVTASHLEITSTACNQPGADGNCPNATPGPDYVQRRITAQL
jgi:MSHA biogenesis protein MshP